MPKKSFFTLNKLIIKQNVYNFAPTNEKNILGKFEAFKLPLRSMQRGTHEFEMILDTEFFRNMESEDILNGNVKVNATVNCKGDYYDCDFVAKGTIGIVCDRCLDEMQHEVDTTYHLCVKYGECYNDESDELLIIPEKDAYLNVAYMLYDTVALTIPLKHTHPAGKCNKGMTKYLSKHSASEYDEDGDEFFSESDYEDTEIDNNAQVDPRWEALRKLTENN